MSEQIPPHLAWMADAPLFIDDSQVASFYDAVARPPGRATQQKYTVTDSRAKEIAVALGVKAEADAGAIIGMLAGIFPSLKAEVSAQGDGSAAFTNETQNEILIESIDTPQRQLIQLVVHYLLNNPTRFFLVENLTTNSGWRAPEIVRQVPRALVFLDLPGVEEAKTNGLPATMLIPTAAEFDGIGVIPLYKELKGKDGSEAPSYPGPAVNEEGKKALKAYWAWFAQNYSSTSAMEIVEKTAKQGKIRWIDYRVPMNNEGETLHLHLCPSGKYDTGTFAYNLVKRGFKHGLRLVGTVKSEPDVNVLAIYEK